MGSSPVPLKTRRVGQRCTLNLSRAETSSRCFLNYHLFMDELILDFDIRSRNNVAAGIRLALQINLREVNRGELSEKKLSMEF
ncbi:hypothetical protein TNCV_2372821 [Trichonephila clavipes]|nr:hypothetical protein TNCV_2372821 [Trichonephila clavipes]